MTDGGTRRGYLEEILVHIPGFKGYLAREYRRDSDKACRDHLAARLGSAKRAVGETKRRLLTAGKLGEIEQLDRVSDRLERVVSRLTHAERGYSGFFDSQKIGPEELDRLHEADLALTELALAIETKLSGLSAAAAGEAMGAAVVAAVEAIATFEQTFDRRKQVLTEVV